MAVVRVEKDGCRVGNRHNHTASVDDQQYPSQRESASGRRVDALGNKLGDVLGLSQKVGLEQQAQGDEVWWCGEAPWRWWLEWLGWLVCGGRRCGGKVRVGGGERPSLYSPM